MTRISLIVVIFALGGKFSYASETNYSVLMKIFTSYGRCGGRTCISGQVKSPELSQLFGQLTGTCFSEDKPNLPQSILLKFEHTQIEKYGQQTLISIVNGESFFIRSNVPAPLERINGTRNSFSDHLRTDLKTLHNDNVIVNIREWAMADRALYVYLRLEHFGLMNDEHLICEVPTRVL